MPCKNDHIHAKEGGSYLRFPSKAGRLTSTPPIRPRPAPTSLGLSLGSVDTPPAGQLSNHSVRAERGCRAWRLPSPHARSGRIPSNDCDPASAHPYRGQHRKMCQVNMVVYMGERGRVGVLCGDEDRERAWKAKETA